MSDSVQSFAIVGLGKMGDGMAKHALSRAVAMLRHGFGGHPFGAAANIAKERHTGRVGGFVGNGKSSPP
mgnify:CR=1 FL=1